MTPQLLTTDQAAQRLGVVPRRLRAIAATRADFPAPAVERRGRGGILLWDAAAIDRWNRTAERRVGRPRKSEVGS